MREILRTNDQVLVNYVEVLLKNAGLDPVIADVNMSVLEGSIGILPRRVLVMADVWERARQVLRDAGLEAWIADRDGG